MKYCRKPRYRYLPVQTRSARLLLAGHLCILLALWDYAIRLARHSAEHILYAEHFSGSVSSALILLWMAGLGLAYLEHSRWQAS